MAETLVSMDLAAFEHARIDRNMKIRELAEKLGRHPGSISNQLVKARRGERLGVSQVAALAWGLGISVESLIEPEPPSPMKS